MGALVGMAILNSKTVGGIYIYKTGMCVCVCVCVCVLMGACLRA